MCVCVCVCVCVCIRSVRVCIVLMSVQSFDESRRGPAAVFSDLDCSPSVSQEMATSDPCANAPPTPPEEPEPSPSPRKKRGRRKLEQNEKNKGIDLTQSHVILSHICNNLMLKRCEKLRSGL